MMAKKCIICNEVAVFCIKDSSECYCEECAKEYFADISVLQKIEDEAQKVKDFINEKIEYDY